jgi:hypothetical protein
MAAEQLDQPDVAAFERHALGIFYRTERQWRVLACWTSLLGAGGIWLGARAGGVVLMSVSILCQLVSWRAMRGAQRLEAKRLARLEGERR